jgi:hydroxysqualene dehydroxylase
VTDRGSVAVVGAGWSGLAAAVEACSQGRAVTLFEMAAHVGGRARSVTSPSGVTLDNGQHILIGAYRETLSLMKRVGVDPRRMLLRMPLELRYPDGRGLKLPGGPPLLAFALGTLSACGWSWSERWQLLRVAAGWWLRGMRNPGVATVAELCATLPARLRLELIEPLCVAALNTPADEACATVFLRVLGDALFAEHGGSDLLLPRAGLSELLPARAAAWLVTHGAAVRAGRRVLELSRGADQWRVDGARFDAVVLACPAAEAARLVQPLDAAWAMQARGLRHEPIATVYLERRGPALAPAMVVLPAGDATPAQFAFDLEVLGVAPATVAFVVSGARRWLADGLDALKPVVLEQARRCFVGRFDGDAGRVIHACAERRATLACTPGLHRPRPRIADGLFAAGDYVEGPYPSTLEGAVRSGVRAARLL